MSKKKPKSDFEETSVRKSTDTANFQNGPGHADRAAWVAKDGDGKGAKMPIGCLRFGSMDRFWRPSPFPFQKELPPPSQKPQKGFG